MTEQQPRGRFVWFDLITTEPDATPAFYSRVTGWRTTLRDAKKPYTMWTNNGTTLGGVMKLSKPSTHPHWLAYICTPNLDETVEQADDLGARILAAPTVVPNVGSFAVIMDPQGAAFAAFTPESSAPGHDGPAALGEFSWHELATHDYPAAYRFYERLFGWEKMAAVDMGETGIYQMYGRHGIQLGGMYNRPSHVQGPPSWVHYVRVADVRRATELVEKHGGRVLVAPMEVPGGDWIAQFADPQGAVFAVHQKKGS